eukprot:199314_1
MPLDINILRTNPDAVKQSQQQRYKETKIVDDILEIDKQWKQLIVKCDKVRKQSRAISIQIGKIFKNAKKEQRTFTDKETSSINKLKQTKTTYDAQCKYISQEQYN